jgi:hypothetical protein
MRRFMKFVILIAGLLVALPIVSEPSRALVIEYRYGSPPSFTKQYKINGVWQTVKFKCTNCGKNPWGHFQGD